MDGIDMRDLPALRTFITKLKNFEEELRDSAESMNNEVNGAGDWWHDDMYTQLQDNWEESYAQLSRFFESIPGTIDYLTQIADGIEDVKNKRLRSR